MQRIRRPQCHRQILTTDKTLELLQVLRPGAKVFPTRPRSRPSTLREIALSAPYDQIFSLGEVDLKLLPSGYLIGAASLLLRYRDRSVLFAGALGTGQFDLAEPRRGAPCDILILHCHATLNRKLRPRDMRKSIEKLLRISRTHLRNGQSPILLCGSIGEGLAIARALLQSDLPYLVHPQLGAIWKKCNQLAPDAFFRPHLPVYRRRLVLDRNPRILVWPLRLRHSPGLQQIHAPYPITLTVGNVGGSRQKRASLENSFPSWHFCPYPDILTYVRSCAPWRVVLTGNPTADLVADLKDQGREILTMSPEMQLEIPFGRKGDGVAST